MDFLKGLIPSNVKQREIVEGDVGVEKDPAEDEDEVQAGDETKEVESAETGPTPTTDCDGDNLTYNKKRPIVSITFLLAEENPFEVMVGTGTLGTDYKEAEKKAHRVLCKIKDFTDDSSKIVSLKHKGCIEEKIPKALAPVLTNLNELLLDKFRTFYDKEKYNKFVEAQSEFLKSSKSVNAQEGDEDEDEDEEGDKDEGKGESTEERDTAELSDLQQKIISVFTKGLTEKDKINYKQEDLIEKLKDLSKQNGIDYNTLQAFLAKLNVEKREDELYPLYLLKQKEAGNPNKQLILTANGIITDGEVIYSYLNVDLKNGEISRNALGRMWTLTDNYDEALSVLKGKKDNWFITDEVVQNEFKKASGGIGKRKTLSKKLLKRATRRNRK